MAVTPGQPRRRQTSTRSRNWFVKSFGRISVADCSDKLNSCCPAPRWRRGGGIGTKCSLRRRPSTTSSVMPSSSNRKCQTGMSKGPLMIGFSIRLDMHP